MGVHGVFAYVWCMCSLLCVFTGVVCRDMSNNITICTQSVRCSGWGDSPIHPSVVRATRLTIHQNTIRRSYTEVCSTSSTCQHVNTLRAYTPLPIFHGTRAFFLSSLNIQYHSFNCSRLLLKLLRFSLSTTSC